MNKETERTRIRLDRGECGPFIWKRPDGLIAQIARDPGVPMTAGYVGRFLWAVIWPAVAGSPGTYRPAQTRHGVTISLVNAEAAITGAVELGRPPWSPPAVSQRTLL